MSKFKETAFAVLPVAAIILLLHFTVAPMPGSTLALFLSGTVLLIIGMALFTLGADLGMTPMGNQIGEKLVKMRNLPFFIIAALLLGFFVTIAEPDLQVLAKQMPDIIMFNLFGMDFSVGTVLIFAVAAGVGFFLMFSVVRILLKMKLSVVFLVFYIIVFIVAAFTQKEYLAVAFDSGGVTTGPITVPFILALGVGIASVSGRENSMDDSFGFVALCSIGPILTVLIMGMFIKGDASYSVYIPQEINSFSQLAEIYFSAFPVYAKEVILALSPIILFYLIFQFVFLRLPKKTVAKTLIGVVYTYIGLVVFLTAVNVGFLPAGSFMGGAIASLDYNWILIPIGMLVGFFIVAAEPAVHILTGQVETVSGGSISRKNMMIALMIGMSISVGLAMLRVLTGISIWYLLIPGYLIAVGLMFFSPKIFTAIAFDSGGVASGPMTATFLLPFAMGACTAVGGNVLMDGFGVVAMVAMTPLVTIQILGTVYSVKEKQIAKKQLAKIASEEISSAGDECIIEFLEPENRNETENVLSVKEEEIIEF